MTEYYQISLALTNGKSRLIRVPRPDKTLAPEAVIDAVTELINSMAFAASSRPTNAKKIELIGVSRTPIAL